MEGYLFLNGKLWFKTMQHSNIITINIKINLIIFRVQIGIRNIVEYSGWIGCPQQRYPRKKDKSVVFME